VDPTQVRKDLAEIRLRGRGRVGYDPDEVITAIRRVLGFDRTHLAVLVGAGHLGAALAAYRGFAKYGLRIVAAFDCDPDKVGRDLAGCPVQHTDRLGAVIAEHGIRLAILTTPVEGTQELADRLVAAGVRAIWSFAPVRLTVPPGVRVRSEHISVGLSELTHHLAEGGDETGPPRDLPTTRPFRPASPPPPRAPAPA
jgi:redox-sensing transcriptional repressor